MVRGSCGYVAVIGSGWFYGTHTLRPGWCAMTSGEVLRRAEAAAGEISRLRLVVALSTEHGYATDE